MSLNASEVLIVGGGLVGLTLAIALKTQGFSIKLIDQNPLLKTDPSDTRSLALSFSSVEFLKTLVSGTLWASLKKVSTPLAHLHISEAGTSSLLRLHAEEYGESAFGYVVPITEIYTQLSETARALEINILSSTRVTSVQAEEGRVVLETGETLQADLILACDGARSFIRESLQLKTEQYDYHHTALVTSVILPSSHEGWAFERFLSDGVLALLPLSKQAPGFASAVVWIQSPEKTQAMMELSNEALLPLLQEAFGHRLGKFLKLGARHTYPLQQIIAKTVFSGRVLLMGNAAHQLNPVGAQGWNLALRDIALLLKLLDKNMTKVPSFSVKELTEKIFQPYETLRKPDQTLIESVTHTMAVLYGSSDILSVLSRRLTVSALRGNRCFREKFVLALMGKKAYRAIQEVSDAG